MNVTTLKAKDWSERYDFRKKWLEYAKACKANRNKQDEALKNAYRELAQGKIVIPINQIFSETGLDHRGYPKLAIARAHWTQCGFGFSEGDPVFHDVEHISKYRGLKKERYPLRFGVLGGSLTPAQRRDMSIRSVVPPIPPVFRPDGDLSDYFILFEPQWEAPPKPDPFLLKPLGEDLMLVCAVWDMTPLERAVLFGK